MIDKTTFGSKNISETKIKVVKINSLKKFSKVVIKLMDIIDSFKIFLINIVEFVLIKKL